MKKKHSIGRFITLAVLCAIVLALTIFKFPLPAQWGDSDFYGFARAINLGIEYQGGTSYQYSVKSNSTKNFNLENGISSSMTRIKTLLENNLYTPNVYRNGDSIVVELLDEYSPVGITDIINADPYFAIKSEQSDTAEEKIKAEDVSTAYGTTSGGNIALIMTFTDAGKTKMADLTSSGSGTMYIYIGTAVLPLSYSEQISNGVLGATLGSGATLDQANYYASEIVCSKYDLSFEENGVTTFSKEDAKRNVIMAVCLTAGLFAICVAILCIVFKKLGLVGSLVMLMALLLQIILLQAVPIFVLTGPSLFASLLCMIIGAMSIYLMFNKMHAEYKMGKILYASVKFGYDKIWLNIFDMYLVLLFPSVITYFFGSYFVKQFAMALICGLSVWSFSTLLFTRSFSRWFTNISFKNKDYGFKREAHVDELK